MRSGLVYENSKYNYNGTKCKLDNWLSNNSYYWTITPINTDGKSVFVISLEGFANSSYVYNSSYGVFPSLYLTTNTKIIDGDGTVTNPYRLG